MDHNLKKATGAVNAEADAVGPLLNSGKIRLYTTPQAADADTAIGAQTLLAELVHNATAYGASSGGVITANAITPATAVATGKATWYRKLKSDGSTKVMDGSVGMKLTGTDISFDSATKKITRTAGGFNSTNLANGHKVVVTGSTSNNGTYTIASFTDTQITINETLVNESAGASVTVSEQADCILANVNVQVGVQVSMPTDTFTEQK
jgi:hypothetical protein